MPREKQKRGRRAETKNGGKRKRNDEPIRTKRQKPCVDGGSLNITHHPAGLENDYILLEEPPVVTNDVPFYGLLDREEQEYFSQASGVLDLNRFENAEERSLFIESVYEE